MLFEHRHVRGTVFTHVQAAGEVFIMYLPLFGFTKKDATHIRKTIPLRQHRWSLYEYDHLFLTESSDRSVMWSGNLCLCQWTYECICLPNLRHLLATGKKTLFVHFSGIIERGTCHLGEKCLLCACELMDNMHHVHQLQLYMGSKWSQSTSRKKEKEKRKRGKKKKKKKNVVRQ